MFSHVPACTVVALLAVTACGGSGDDSRGGDALEDTRPTSTTLVAPPAAPDCDDAAMLAIVEEQLAAARLTPGDEWSPDALSPFDDRTYPHEAFNDQLGFDCSLRAVQTTSDGDTRLLLAAWTFPRYGFVVQATDEPAGPYAQVIRFQLLLEQPDGEWIDDQVLWAGTMAGGESIVVGAEDYGIGAVAKAWQSDFDPLPPGEVTLASERFAIDALEATRHRMVAVAVEATFGSEVGTIMFASPEGQVALATVAPLESSDPMQPYLSGATSTEQIQGVDVRVTLPAVGEYDVGDVGWECGRYGWRLMGSFGTDEELVEVASALIDHLDC